MQDLGKRVLCQTLYYCLCQLFCSRFSFILLITYSNTVVTREHPSCRVKPSLKLYQDKFNLNQTSGNSCVLMAGIQHFWQYTLGVLACHLHDLHWPNTKNKQRLQWKYCHSYRLGINAVRFSVNLILPRNKISF